ncbi:MAG: hypothetical protein R2828_17135 [Saprospiraceae bacterium]
MGTIQPFLTQVEDLIAKDELGSAIALLHQLLQDSPKLDEAILQSARLTEVKKQIRLGLINYEQANLTKNQIRAGLLELLEEIGEQRAIPAIKSELERYAVRISGKNIVGGNISAGGDVRIGDHIEQLTESKTSRNIRLFLLVFVPLLAIAAAVLYFQYRQSQQSLTVVVGIDNLTPNPNLPFEGGQVTLQYGGKAETLAIEKEAIFRGIPANYRREPVRVQFDALGFLKIDTTVLLNTETLNLSIRRDDTYGRVFGVVVEEREKTPAPLEGVTVSILDISTQTDENGRFSLSIPFEKQRKQQRLRATKAGYESFDHQEPVIKNEETLISLQKTNTQ